MARFRIIHISDLHLCTKPGRRNAISILHKNKSNYADTSREILSSLTQKKASLIDLIRPASYDPSVISKVAKFCYDRRKSTDAILISGDIACTGDLDDLQVGKKFIFSPITKEANRYIAPDGNPTLSSSASEKLVIAGNHDRYADWVATPNCNKFDQVFGNSKRDDVGALRLKKGRAALYIIYGDFCLRDSVLAGQHQDSTLTHKFGHGCAYEDIIQKMIAKTKEARERDSSCRIVWLTHFNPLWEGSDLILHNRRMFTEAARKLDIDLILSGHTHSRSFNEEQDLKLFCAGTAMCVENNGEYTAHIIDLSFEKEDKKLSGLIEDFVYSFDQDEFKQKKRREI